MKHNWTYKKVKEVCDKESSNIVLNKIENNTGDFPLYGASGFVKGINFYHREEPYIGIVKDGAGVGRVNVYPAKSSLVGTMQYILPKENVQLHYLCYALQGLNLAKLVSGATIPHIYFKDYGEFPIPLPPLATQSRIVAEFDLLQSVIDKQKAQLKELDNLAQAIFYDMFGDPVENEKGWEVKKLGDFCSKIGSGATPRGGNESYKSEGVSLIRSLNVHNNAFIYKDLAFIDEEQAQTLSNVEVQLNDILLNITGASVARCCIVPNQLLPARVNQHVCIIRPSKDAEVRFLSRLLTNSQYQVFLIDLARGKAATREALPKNIVEGLPIILPPLSLQQSFAQKIKAIERQRDLINQSIREARTLFDSRMEYYFGE